MKKLDCVNCKSKEVREDNTSQNVTENKNNPRQKYIISAEWYEKHQFDSWFEISCVLFEICLIAPEILCSFLLIILLGNSTLHIAIQFIGSVFLLGFCFLGIPCLVVDTDLFNRIQAKIIEGYNE